MIEVAKSAGFCFGVDRSVKLVYSLLKKDKKIATIGPIIHNSFVVDDLKEKGVIIEENIDNIPDGYIAVIRSHGVSPSVYESLEDKCAEFEDATCPFVSKIHNIVRDEYKKGKKILIAGNETHPEVIGINGFCKNTAIVFKNEEELQKISQNGEINGENDYVLVAQTTFNKNEWQKCIKFLKKLYTNIDFFDTICNATAERQNEAEKIAAESDIMFVIGGRNSSNTNKLREVCETYCKTILIQSASELQKQDIIGKYRIGITAGASTPAYIIEEVKNKMSELLENEEFSFEEALEH